MFKMMPVFLLTFIVACGNTAVLQDPTTGRVTSVPASLANVCQIETSEDLTTAEALLAVFRNLRSSGVPQGEAFLAFSLAIGSETQDPQAILCLDAMISYVYSPFSP